MDPNADFAELKKEVFLDKERFLAERLQDIQLLRKPISGTYKNSIPAPGNTILELRVDVDGRRPQQRRCRDYDL